MEQKYKMFFALISSQFTQHKLSEQNKRVCSQEIIHEFLELAKKHDILHLLALGLKENDLLDWGQEEKGMRKDEMVGWHHQLNGHEFGWTPGVGDGPTKIIMMV